ncbi:MAG: hypothetical protein Q8K94_04770, partial [Moraxellaceae bacterium]|nr:hypothetical protein [Moraxellaceae bacterium]
MADILVKAMGLQMAPSDRLHRAQQKRAIVLEFLADEVWSSIAIMQLLLDLSYSTTHALLKAMVAEGLLREKAMFVGSTSGARQILLVGITSHGVAMAPNVFDASRSPWEASKTHALGVPHQLLTQRMRLRSADCDWSEWLPARRLMGLGIAKLPDAQAIDSNGQQVAVEIERHIKTSKRYEAVVGAYIYEIRNHARWTRVDYVCPNVQFAQRLSHAFGGLRQLRLEVKGLPSRSAVIEQTHLDRFRFYS